MNFLKKLFSGNNDNPELAQSNIKAKSRLHFVLVQDRTGMNSQEMTSFKEELVGVIEKYFEIDKKGFDINYKREGEATALVINSPVLVRRAAKRTVKKEDSTNTTTEAVTPA